MPELKHAFGAGRMNKDKDERLVPNGEYRDAKNIEISTSEGSNTGVVQTLLGNTKRDSMQAFSLYPNGVSPTAYYDLQNIDGGNQLATNSATCVGTIAASDRDKIYYFVHSAQNIQPTSTTELDIHKDYIVEYDTVSQGVKYVFVDISKVNTTTSGSSSQGTTFSVTAGAGVTTNQTGIRIGMQVVIGTTIIPEDNVRVTNIAYVGSNWQITVDQTIGPLTGGVAVEFIASPVLNFTRDNLITGINILDDFIYWTDNENEPKKINIPKSIAGTGGTEYLQGAGNGGVGTGSPTNDIFQGENAYFHTRLVIDEDTSQASVNMSVATNPAGNEVVYVEESHITVIRRSPVTRLDLDMYRTTTNRVNPATGVANPVTSVCTLNLTTESGEIVNTENTLDIVLDTACDFRLGDVLLLAKAEPSAIDFDQTFDENTRSIRGTVISTPNGALGPDFITTGNTNAPFVIDIDSISEDLDTNDQEFIVRLEDRDPLFAFKFPRFSYRYRYTDGEYSTFAPFSEVAFLPDNFDYQPKKGHNLGMINQMKGLRIKNYFPQHEAMLQNVAEIDILYKETNNPTVYTVKTIKPTDGHPLWPDNNSNPNARGEFEITTDMIHAIVPSNQLIRPYDNVPRKALAQEITANRIVYGNYLQNYTVDKSPKLNLAINSSQLSYGSNLFAQPSVKTMRDYHVGIVFSDKYGRETPVLTNKDATIRVPKTSSTSQNRISASFTEDTVIPSWAEYFSFYIKETSVEYYTLSQDRWYNASDGNIWLSFPSSERNKIGEDEFLILKKAHGSNEAVYEKAKYKILAIENEAPDFIKTRRISLGKVVDQDGSTIGTSGFGFPLPQTNKVVIQESEFEAQFGDELYKERPKNLYLRVWQGATNRSKFYLVTSLAHSQPVDSIAGSPYTITIDEAFGDDVSFTSTEGTYSTQLNGVAIELIEFRVINAPEFDGRFFVKIFKDQALSEYVAQASEEDYYIEQTFELGYINNNAYLNAGLWTLPAGSTTFTPRGYEGVIPQQAVHPSGLLNVNKKYGQSSYIVGPDEIEYYTSFNFGSYFISAAYSGSVNKYDHIHGAHHPTEHDWSGLANFGGNSASQSDGGRYIWSDGNEDANDQQLLRMMSDPMRALNGSEVSGADYNTHFGGGDNVMENSYGKAARHFWNKTRNKRRFFIDAASAFSWTGGRQAAPGNRYHHMNLTGNTNFGVLTFPPLLGSGDDIIEGGFVGISDENNFPQIPTDVAQRAVVAGDLSGFIEALKFCIGKCNFHAYLDEAHRHNADSFNQIPTYMKSYFTEGHPDYAEAYIPENWSEETCSNAKLLDYDTTDSNSIISSRNFARQHYGVPSRGIWKPDGWEGSAIDISWCSWRQEETWPTVSSDYHISATLEHNASIPAAGDPMPAQEAWNFIQSLCTSGAKFRFQKDPDQIIYTVFPYKSPYVSIGYDNPDYYAPGTTEFDGLWGIRNFMTSQNEQGYNTDEGQFGGAADYTFNGGNYDQYGSYNRRQRWTILVTPEIGSGPHGYNPIHGTDPDAMDPSLGITDPNWRRALKHDNRDADIIEIISPFTQYGAHFSNLPGVWETEPKESVELDIYYEASNKIPIKVTNKTNEEFIPLGSKIVQNTWYNVTYPSGNTLGSVEFTENTNNELTLTSWSGNTLNFSGSFEQSSQTTGTITYNTGDTLQVELPDGSCTTVTLAQDVNVGDNTITIEENYLTKNSTFKLGWNNCWCFGNGAESDRIRDDFNAPQMDNGVKVSATVAQPRIQEERRKYGLIYSGIYNSIAGVNETNQFIAGESITKDINPTNGSIQALKGRDTRLIMFCEDKVLRADTNRDLLFNADGNSQVVSSNSVIGSAVAYKGDYGISTNPESLAVTPNRMYFTDVMRGKVLSLSTEGVAPISDIGMKDYFADLLSANVFKAIGTYDARKSEYNISVGNRFYKGDKYYNSFTTVSYSEISKGWVSLKTFSQDVTPTGSTINFVKGLEAGISLNNQYYTFFDGHIWQHHSNDTRNNFYGSQNTSDVTVLFNDQPSDIKSFNTVNYEGSQARVTNFDTETFAGYYNNTTANNGYQTGITTITDGEYHNLGDDIAGWSVENIITDLQSCGTLEFKDKEGKWFAFPTGDTTTLTNLDEKEFSVQGLGQASMTHDTPGFAHPITITVKDSTTNAAGDVTWN